MNALPMPVRVRLARLRALSLVELLVVLVILSVVASILWAGSSVLQTRADERSVLETASSIERELDAVAAPGRTSQQAVRDDVDLPPGAVDLGSVIEVPGTLDGTAACVHPAVQPGERGQVVAGSCAPCEAGATYTATTAAELQDALDDEDGRVAPGETLSVCVEAPTIATADNGGRFTYTGDENLFLDGTATLTGGGEHTILDASESAADTVTVNNLTWEEGWPEVELPQDPLDPPVAGGGAIVRFGGDLVVGGSSVFRNNEAAVFVDGDAVVTGDAVFRGNRWASALVSTDTVVVEGDAVFENNETGGWGGGILATDVIVSGDATFTNNTAGIGARGAGGAILAHENVTLSGSITFTDNRSHPEEPSPFVVCPPGPCWTGGGAVHGVNVAVESGAQVEFEGNTSGTAGGGVYADGHLSIDEGAVVVFDGNESTYRLGGAVVAESYEIASGDVSFDGNEADDATTGAISSASSGSVSSVNESVQFSGVAAEAVADWSAPGGTATDSVSPAPNVGG